MVQFPNIVDLLPEGEQGAAKIEHFEVSKDASAFTALRPMSYVPPGRYAKLTVHGTLMMSDTRMERNSNYEVVRRSKGEVLIAGLGLGLVLHPILRKPEVTRVDVLEKYRDVIDLVEPKVRQWEGGYKLNVIEADVLEWQPPKGQKWDTIYFDIWPNITTDNLAEMKVLHRRFGRRKPLDGWMGSWQHDALKHRKRREDKERRERAYLRRVLASRRTM